MRKYKNIANGKRQAIINLATTPKPKTPRCNKAAATVSSILNGNSRSRLAPNIALALICWLVLHGYGPGVQAIPRTALIDMLLDWRMSRADWEALEASLQKTRIPVQIPLAEAGKYLLVFLVHAEGDKLLNASLLDQHGAAGGLLPWYEANQAALVACGALNARADLKGLAANKAG